MNLPVSKHADALKDFTIRLLEESISLGAKQNLVKVYFNVTNYDTVEEFEVAPKKLFVTKGYSGKYCVTFMLEIDGILVDADKVPLKVENKIPRMSKQQMIKTLSVSPYFTFDVDVEYHDGEPFQIFEHTMVTASLQLKEHEIEHRTFISRKETCDILLTRDYNLKRDERMQKEQEAVDILISNGHSIDYSNETCLSLVNLSNDLNFQGYRPDMTAEVLEKAVYDLSYHERLYLFGKVSQSKIFKIHKKIMGIGANGIANAFSRTVSMNMRGMDMTGKGSFLPQGMHDKFLLGAINSDPLS